MTLIHTAIIYVWTVGVTILMGLTAIAVSFFDSTGDHVHRVARAWARSILWISGMRVYVSGFSRIDPERSYIYMPNHQSNYDIPVLLGRLTVQFRWLAKAELFKIPIFGRGMRGAGYISIDRSNRESAFRSLKRAARIIGDGTSVLIFPEGTRSADGAIRPFKKGGFVLAVDAGVPIVPVIIRGTRSVMPKHRLLIRRAHVAMEILEPVDTAGYTRKTKDELVEKVRKILVDANAAAPESGASC